MNYEEGSEYSMMDGDGVSDAALAEMASVAVPRGERDLAAESMFEYGSRAGFWRLHRIFQERRLPMTIYACALALERNPPAAQAIKEAGYDICCHGWRWVEHFKLDEATEREHVRRAVESLETNSRTASAWLVLPLRAERQHATPRHGGGRLSL